MGGGEEGGKEVKARIGTLGWQPYSKASNVFMVDIIEVYENECAWDEV